MRAKAIIGDAVYINADATPKSEYVIKISATVRHSRVVI